MGVEGWGEELELELMSTMGRVRAVGAVEAGKGKGAGGEGGWAAGVWLVVMGEREGRPGRAPKVRVVRHRSGRVFLSVGRAEGRGSARARWRPQVGGDGGMGRGVVQAGRSHWGCGGGERRGRGRGRGTASRQAAERW